MTDRRAARLAGITATLVAAFALVAGPAAPAAHADAVGTGVASIVGPIVGSAVTLPPVTIPATTVPTDPPTTPPPTTEPPTTEPPTTTTPTTEPPTTTTPTTEPPTTTTPTTEPPTTTTPTTSSSTSSTTTPGHGRHGGTTSTTSQTTTPGQRTPGTTAPKPAVPATAGNGGPTSGTTSTNFFDQFSALRAPSRSSTAPRAKTPKPASAKSVAHAGTRSKTKTTSPPSTAVRKAPADAVPSASRLAATVASDSARNGLPSALRLTIILLVALLLIGVLVVPRPATTLLRHGQKNGPGRS